jgi:hypothetical protein
MSAEVAHELQSTIRGASAARSLRVRAVLALGPLTAIGGIAWAVLQPWRLTLLHPHAQSFWWLVAEPPLYVVLVGIAFRLVVAPGVAEDLEAER